jgi:hypothetical protein
MNSRVALATHIVNFSAARVGLGAVTAFGTLTTRLGGRRQALPQQEPDDPATRQWRRELHIKTADAFDDVDEFEE